MEVPLYNVPEWTPASNKHLPVLVVSVVGSHMNKLKVIQLHVRPIVKQWFVDERYSHITLVLPFG